MVTHYFPEFFSLDELVPREHYLTLPHSELWWLLDARLLFSADALRRLYGPMVCNDWHVGGGNEYRGWRPSDCPVGADRSDHKWGRALDLVPLRTSARAIRQDIRAGADERLMHAVQYITAIEAGVGWLHISVRNVSPIQWIGRR
ncbi:hypothetical protein [Desulfohalovibrio reitneri]|uniref:hypothetical protein n=1 Tax=Desulfohalovibrio reitneri TaxID=1307759 RepID=UPI000691B3FE|nr:hypothetical protein [Desulfohalovibrio reitneri]